MIYPTEVQTAHKSTPQAQTRLKDIPYRRALFLPGISQRKVLLVGVDLALLITAFLLGLHLTMGMPLSFTNIVLYPVWFAMLTILWLVIASAGGSYDVKRAAQLTTSAFSIVKALLVTAAFYACLSVLFPSLLTTPSSILLIGALAAGPLVLWRIGYATFLVQPNFQRRAVIAGAGRAGRTIAQIIKEHDPGYEIVGYVDGDVPEQERDSEGVSILAQRANLNTFVQDHRVSDIILAVPHNLHADQLRAVMKCFERGVRIVPMPDLLEGITGRIPVERIGESWLVSLPIDWDSRRLYQIGKRAMDIVFAGIGLLLLAPLFPFLALAIKLDSPGPIFYRPERLGRAGKPFRLWKFRTMVSNADRIGDPTFTTTNDQRITRVGRILRTTHVDELPQFINVLAGDMSLVGPRPERQVPELEESIPYYRARCAVKPGATGWALVKQGYAEGIEDTLIKLQYDLYYIKHRSLLFDLVILFKSAVHMLAMRGR